MAVITSSTSGLWDASDVDTWGLGADVQPAITDDVIVDNGDTVTLNDNEICNSFAVLGTGVYDGAGFTLQVDGKNGAGLSIDLDGECATGRSDFDLRIDDATILDLEANGGGSVRNFTINDASCVATLERTTLISGDLTITAGELDTGADKDLTVIGSTIIDGLSAGTEVSRLQLNGSTAILGSGIISAVGVGVRNGGGFYADADSTVTMGSLDANYDGSNEVRLLGTNVINSYSDSNRIVKLTSGVIDASGTSLTITTATTGKTISIFDTQFDNLTLTPASSTTYNMVSNGIDIAGDLTINANATLDTTGSNYPLTVAGACDVSGTLTCNASAVSFGALEILTGATWNATSGTTTIGNESQSTTAGTRGFFVSSGATFAHNSGTISFTGTNHISPCHGGTQTYNNITFAQSGSIQIRDTNTGSDNWIIAGTLTINSGATITLEAASNRINCTGDCVVAGTMNLNHADGGDHNFGSLTINSGGTYSATSGTTTITGGFRPSDVAGTLNINGGSFAFGGTGGLFEGDFLKDAREVRINQDKVLNFDGSSTKVQITKNSDFEPTTAITASCWAYAEDWTAITASRLFSNTESGGYGIAIDVSDNNKIGWYCHIGGSYEEALTPLSTISAGWHHFMGTCDGRYNNLYIDGILITRVDDGSANSINYGTADLVIGAEPTSASVSSTSEYFGNGKISDVRVYDKVLDGDITTVGASATGSLAKLASKMFIGVDSPVGWWKLNEDAFLDSGSGGNNGTGTGTAGQWSYNDFGVDIQDNTTTVSNLIVESGQLNTKALTHLNFGGASDSERYVNIGSNILDYNTTQPFTFEFEYFHTAANHSNGGTIFTTENATNDKGFRISIGSDTAQIQGNGSGRNWSSNMVVGKWHHLVYTYDGAGSGQFYQAGAADGVVTGYSLNLTTANGAEDDSQIGSHAAEDTNPTYNHLHGKLRYLKLYDYHISADHAASMYRGSYNVTPLHWYKMDDDSGATGAVVDSGTASAANGTGTALDWTDGSLKVNGAARVLDNGSVS